MRLFCVDQKEKRKKIKGFLKNLKHISSVCFLKGVQNREHFIYLFFTLDFLLKDTGVDFPQSSRHLSKSL